MSDMVTVTIDDRQVDVPAGSTILDAAGALGISIPTLCFLKGSKALNSCFVCVVQVEGRGSLNAACSTVVADGIVVHSDSEEVREARKTAFELLLSEHHGDCEGPCTIACPADLDIPAMLEHVVMGDMPAAVRTARTQLLFNSVLGSICPRFC